MITGEQLWRSVSLSEPVFQHAGHHFVINYGLKVLRNDRTGEIHMRNTRVGGDFYGPVADYQYLWVFTYGFEIGARLIAIDTIVNTISSINSLIQNSRGNSLDKLRSYRSNLIKQIIKEHEKINDLQRRELNDDAGQKLQALIANIITGERGAFGLLIDEPRLSES